MGGSGWLLGAGGWGINWALNQPYVGVGGRGLKQEECILSQFWRLKVWDQGMARLCLLRKLFASSRFWQFLAILGIPRLETAWLPSLCLSSLCVSGSKLPLSLKMPVIGLGSIRNPGSNINVFSGQVVLPVICYLPLVSYNNPNCTLSSGISCACSAMSDYLRPHGS